MIPDSCAGSLRPPRAPAARGVTSKIALLGPCAGGRPARPGPRPAAWAKGAADRPNDSLFTCFTSGLWGNLDFFILLFYFFPPRVSEREARPPERGGSAPGATPAPIRLRTLPLPAGAAPRPGGRKARTGLAAWSGVRLGPARTPPSRTFLTMPNSHFPEV